MNSFELKKKITERINEELQANPLTDGYVTIGKIYREFETKTLDSNFISISFENFDSLEEHNTEYNITYIYIWCWFENELLAEKFASMFRDRFAVFEIDRYIRIINLKEIAGVDEYDKNLYCKKLMGTIKD